MSVYNKSIDKIINVERTKWIAPGPYVPLITSNIHVFHVPEMRYEEDCELLKQALLQVQHNQTTVDLETKTVKVTVDRFTVNMEQVWNTILQCGVYPKCLGKIEIKIGQIIKQAITSQIS